VTNPPRRLVDSFAFCKQPHLINVNLLVLFTSTTVETSPTQNMDQKATLLTLPPEIRTSIYHHLFAQSYPIHLRTPSHRRLKCSRIDKKDPRGILSACRQLRCEALPIFFSLNILHFRNSCDTLEFLTDPKIHTSIRQVISKVAVDDGDASFQNDKLWEIQSHIISLTPQLPNLEIMEFRVYARHDNTDLMEKFKELRCAWNTFSKACDGSDSDSEGSCVVRCIPARSYGEGTPSDSIQDLGLKAESLCSRTRYEIGDKTALVFLNCNNLIMGRPGQTKTMLGGADQAAGQRCKRVGTMALRDENTLRWTDG
jgi:hypothetical protein